MTATTSTDIDLNKPEFYLNRELSILQFNQRVLQLSLNDSIPLLERLRFLLICSSNLDEFFEIRVAGLKQQIAFGTSQHNSDGLTPMAALKQIREFTQNLVSEQYRILSQLLVPALAKKGIHFLKQSTWTEDQTAWAKQYFRNEVLPVASVVGLDLAHPFPRLVNKSLNFIVSMEGKDAFGRDSGLAIVHVPRALPRVFRLPADDDKQKYNFIYLVSIVYAYVNELFPGMTVTGCYQFRLTRNSDLLLDEATEDLAMALKSKLLTRRYGTAVRLEIAKNCPLEIAEFLLNQHGLTQDELYQVEGSVNLSRLMEVIDQIDRNDLKYPSFTPGLPPVLKGKPDLFAVIRDHDVLLHHPYQSFSPVVEFIRQATMDPDVIAIKQILYRTGPESLMVRALSDAARAGKEVTAVIELRARFEEEYNIDLANRLQEAGALVVYGVMGYKTHAKLTLVVRREGRRMRRYCHLGTGNYHATTARSYVDFGLLTYDQEIGDDVQNVFQQLTGMGKVIKMKKLLNSPFTLHKTLIELIEFETNQAKEGKPAHIVSKLNSLTETKIIQALYRASQAGVKIELIVRGICCLRPRIPGVSENITVRSIVGRFLEHHRIHYFLHGGDEKIYCSSADWMERNFFNRVEVCFPIEDKHLAKRVKMEGLQMNIADNTQSWLLQADGNYKRVDPGKNKLRCAQEWLLHRLSKE
jgi:polyphosphate kinase